MPIDKSKWKFISEATGETKTWDELLHIQQSQASSSSSSSSSPDPNTQEFGSREHQARHLAR